VVRDAAGSCPRDGLALMAHPLRNDQRVRWWCPMHPAVTAEKAGAKCDACGGMTLVPRVVSYRPPGSVLAVPCSAAIDGGGQALVYVDRGAGMFDAKSVTLGPRCGASYPVASGLEPGDRVVAQGAFLLDAETRLDPSLAVGYFGAGEVASAAKPAPTEQAWLKGLAESDRPRAWRQETCPVTGKPLGSMGVPPKLNVRGRDVFLCCKGCAGDVEADPEKYLAKLPVEGAERRP
jgi:Cu(I)/Ag(I) efflux system membrane fusion protein